MKKKEYQNFLFGEDIVFSFVLVESKDGHIMAPRIKGKNCHLTVYVKDDKIFSHTTIAVGKDKEYLHRHEISIVELGTKILDKFKNTVQLYKEKKKCKTLTCDFVEKVFEKTGMLTTEVDFLKLKNLQEDIEFTKKAILKRTKIRDLMGTKFPIGFSRRKIFVVINEKQMLVLHPNVFQETFDFILESFGMNRYFEEFFSTSEGKQILSNIQKLTETINSSGEDDL